MVAGAPYLLSGQTGSQNEDASENFEVETPEE